MEKPVKLYKYKPIDDYLVDLINSDSIWLSEYRKLNDPFDCDFKFSDKFLNKLYDEAAKELFQDLIKLRPDLETLDFQSIKTWAYPILKSQDYERGFYEMIKNELLNWSVCCFTSNSANDLMWAHYGNGHKVFAWVTNFTRHQRSMRNYFQ